MTWAQRLNRVLKIDIETCDHCDGAVHVLASIEASAVIKKILEYIDHGFFSQGLSDAQLIVNVLLRVRPTFFVHDADREWGRSYQLPDPY